jgi:hypothetical protein
MICCRQKKAATNLSFLFAAAKSVIPAKAGIQFVRQSSQREGKAQRMLNKPAGFPHSRE